MAEIADTHIWAIETRERGRRLKYRKRLMQQNPEARSAMAAAGVSPPGSRPAARRRALLRARIRICAALHRRATTRHVGAALAAAYRLGEEAADELAAIPDTDDLRRCDDALLESESEVLERFEAEVGRLVLEYRNGRALDLFTASAVELLACCVARADVD